MTRWLNRHEAAELLGVSCSTLDRWARAGLIQKYHLGPSRRLRFRASELEKAKRTISALPA